MLPLLTTLFLFFSPVSANTTAQTKAWWEDFLKAEVIAALGAPAAAAVTWLVRDYMAKDQEVGRARFKDEIICSMQASLEAASKDKEALISLKLHPLEGLIDRLNTDLREGKITDKEVKMELETIKEEVSDLSVRLKILEGNIEMILGKLNSELSAILTAYTGEPIVVKLFTNSDITPAKRKND